MQGYRRAYSSSLTVFVRLSLLSKCSVHYLQTTSVDYPTNSFPFVLPDSFMGAVFRDYIALVSKAQLIIKYTIINTSNMEARLMYWLALSSTEKC